MKVDNFTETMLWASIRYFMGRHTISASVFPCDIVVNILSELTDEQKMMVLEEINRQLFSLRCVNGITDSSADNSIDLKNWIRLRNYLERTYWRIAHLDDGTEIECFMCDGKFIPVDTYLIHPLMDTYIDNEHIVKLSQVSQ